MTSDGARQLRPRVDPAIYDEIFVPRRFFSLLLIRCQRMAPHESESDNLTLLINSADTAGIQSFTASGQNDQLATADATLD
jgi:hypothetical protein